MTYFYSFYSEYFLLLEIQLNLQENLNAFYMCIERIDLEKPRKMFIYALVNLTESSNSPYQIPPVIETP